MNNNNNNINNNNSDNNNNNNNNNNNKKKKKKKNVQAERLDICRNFGYRYLILYIIEILLTYLRRSHYLMDSCMNDDF